MKYLKILLVVLSLTTLMSFSTASANKLPPASNGTASNSNTFVGDACSGLHQISTTAGCNGLSGGSSLKSITHSVVVVMSYIIGILSIIMIMVAGLKYMTSGGDSNSTASAKNTLIYAIVGLLIALLAQLLAHFALSTANTIQQNSYLNQSSVTRGDS